MHEPIIIGAVLYGPKGSVIWDIIRGGSSPRRVAPSMSCFSRIISFRWMRCEGVRGHCLEFALGLA